MGADVQTVAARLRAAGCVAAEDEARELLAVAEDEREVERMLARRERGEPLAWVTGRVEFCGRLLHVDPGVYVPRAQTEELARRARRRLPPGGRAADLCTGAGAIAAHLQAQVPDAFVVGVDLDPRAVACARRNGVHVLEGDLADVPGGAGPFDVVTAVPPYVPTDQLRLLPADVQRCEPRLALDGGADGVDTARRIVRAAAGLLTPGGWLLVELGDDQDRLLAAELEACGFAEIDTWRDEDRELRGLAAQTAGTRPAP